MSRGFFRRVSFFYVDEVVVHVREFYRISVFIVFVRRDGAIGHVVILPRQDLSPPTLNKSLVVVPGLYSLSAPVAIMTNSSRVIGSAKSPPRVVHMSPPLLPTGL